MAAGNAVQGDSGSGVVAKFGSDKYFLQGFTDMGARVPDHMNIAIDLQKYLYDICFYTGVCVEPEWTKKKLDESKLKVRRRRSQQGIRGAMRIGGHGSFFTL